MTRDDIIETAFGVMKLNPAVFYRMSMREWMLAQRGFFETKKTDMQREWEIARWQSYLMLMPYTKKGTTMTPKSLVRFPWEEEEKVELFEGEDLEWFGNKFGRKFIDGKFVN